MPCEEHPQVLRIAIGIAVHTRTHLLFMARSGSDKRVAWDDSGRADGRKTQVLYRTTRTCCPDQGKPRTSLRFQ